MSWYQHYQAQAAAYPQIYQGQEQYTAQSYQQAWYNYFQQHPHARPTQVAQVSTAAGTTTASTPATTFPATPAPSIQVSQVSSAPNPSTFSAYNPNQSFSTNAGASSSSGTKGKKSALKGVFAKELPKLMYGFGDDKHVAHDSVAVMEEMLVEYIVDVCQTALAPSRKNRLQIEDLRRALSRPGDAKKLARMEELLFLQEDIKRARKVFDDGGMPGDIE